MQCNKEAVTSSLDFVLISCLLINPQMLSLNVLNLQCSKKNGDNPPLHYYTLRVINAMHTNKKGRMHSNVIVSQ